MTFLSPERLVLLVGVVLLAATYLVLQTRRKQYALRFTNLELLGSVAPKRPGWRRHIPALLFLAAIATMVVGFARPVTEQQVPRERATIVMAIDVSLSMMADDVEPTRLDATKVSATSFVDLLPPQLNVALVAFNGNATLKVPPTTDRARLKEAIADLELGERTAIGEAVFASLDAIEAVPADAEGLAPAHIVLMSDGSTGTGRPNAVAAKAAKEMGVPVSTIAFGTDDGEIIDPQSGIPTPVPVDRPALEAIAEQTDGQFFEAASEGQLSEVYANIGTQIGYTTEEQEISSAFIGGALVLLALTSALSLAWFSRLP